jgi:hypothetical protein
LFKYRDLHDGMVKAGLTIPAKKVLLFSLLSNTNFLFRRMQEKNTPAGGDIKDSYNPNGPAKYNFIYGGSLTYNF